MSWVELFLALVVCHLVGDYLLQTDWQARHKRGGLSLHDAVARRALCTHVAVYALVLLPPLLIAGTAVQVVWAIAVIAGSHLIQDDGRLLALYMTHVKGISPRTNPPLSTAVDQSFHIVVLFVVALLIGS